MHTSPLLAPLHLVATRFLRIMVTTGLMLGLGLASQVCALAAVAAPATGERLQLRLGALAEDPRVAGQPVADPWFLTRFFERREFTPAWDSPAKLEGLLAAVAGSARHGLEPADYHHAALEELIASWREAPNANLAVELDLLATDALARLAFHLRFGKVNPEQLESSWNFSRTMDGVSPVTALQALVRADDLAAALDALAPGGYFYLGLLRSLAEHRAIAAAGGWPRVEPGDTLRVEMESPRVAALRQRLMISGDLEAEQLESQEELFDSSLEAAVVRFQARHGLDPDGVVGRQTLAAMNVSVEERLDQLRVNLERVRWVFRDLEPRFLLVNIARYEVMLIEELEVTWSSRVVVGRPYRQTPVFKARMTYLEFNPTWTVPPTILARDLLPDIRRDPDTLQRRNMVVLDREGRRVEPASIDWPNMPARGFPYMIRQQPGPDNALGRVKFMFPNRYHVYMHDTPARELFGRAERTFSSGCIRVERSMELARMLLEGTEWNDAAIERVLTSGRTRVVNLPQPITVLILYGTAVIDGDRTLFLPDVYGRDARVLAALNASPEFLPPAGYEEALRRYEAAAP